MIYPVSNISMLTTIPLGKTKIFSDMSESE